MYLSIYPSIFLSLSPSLYRTPQIGGVGGTGALAHSIIVYIYLDLQLALLLLIAAVASVYARSQFL